MDLAISRSSFVLLHAEERPWSLRGHGAVIQSMSQSKRNPPPIACCRGVLLCLSWVLGKRGCLCAPCCRPALYKRCLSGGDGSSWSRSTNAGMKETCPRSNGDFRRSSSARLSACSIPQMPMWEGMCHHWTSGSMTSSSCGTGDQRSTCCAGPHWVCQLWQRHLFARPTIPSTT